MNMIGRLQETFGFTRSELKVILFLSATLVLGAGIRWYATSARSEAAGSSYQYSVQDREFAERSRRTVATPRALPPSHTTMDGQGSPPAPPAIGSINLNTASKADLMRLPGIGGIYAGRIIRYREEHGPFAAVEDLDRIQGIGRKTIARLRPFVSVR